MRLQVWLHAKRAMVRADLLQHAAVEKGLNALVNRRQRDGRFRRRCPRSLDRAARLDGGDNSIQAHVPLEVPSSDETDERLRWFSFYGNGGTEHLYVVVTREPLQSVPADNDLVTWCSANKDKCPWHPPADVWARILQDTAKSNVRSMRRTRPCATAASARPSARCARAGASSRGIDLPR